MAQHARSLGRRIHRNLVGEMSLLTDVNFYTIEEYLTAITAAVTPQQLTPITEQWDPQTLARAITNFDITCELTLGVSLIKKPAIDRTVLFAQDAISFPDLLAGISSLGELLGDLQVPGKKPSHPTGRLFAYLEEKFPGINSARSKGAIDLMDAVRELRNSGAHPRPSDKLLEAHERLGLPFPLRDPAQAWNIIRARIVSAFNALQEEIYAAL